VPAAPPNDASEEFGRRRRQTWRAARWWLAVGVVGFLGSWFSFGGAGGAAGQARFTVFLLGFIAFGTAIIFMTRAVTRYYRCPVCNEIPKTGSFRAGAGGFSYRSGVDLNPSECPGCGARLK
jgi:hypothetical protein